MVVVLTTAPGYRPGVTDARLAHEPVRRDVTLVRELAAVGRPGLARSSEPGHPAEQGAPDLPAISPRIPAG